MHPPWSMILFTTLAGAGQGLFIALFGLEAAVRLGQIAEPGRTPFVAGAVVVLLLCGAGLAAATFHLGHPLRAWRAAAMWRTSWLSREVIVLPLFMALVAAWGWQHRVVAPGLGLGAVGVATAIALYVCTGMIYGAVRAMREWATPLTPLVFGLVGLASGSLLAAGLLAFTAPSLAAPMAGAAWVATALAAAMRAATMWRNRRLVAERPTLAAAIGVRHPRIVQIAQGAMGGSFGTREFLHGRPASTLERRRVAALVLGAGVPLVGLAVAAPTPGVLVLLAAAQCAGLLAERWLFFADAWHPQNRYVGR